MPHPTCPRAPARLALALACAAVCGSVQAAPSGRFEPGPHCSGDGLLPSSLSLQLGKSMLMHLPEPVLQRSVGNPAVLQAVLISPDTLYVAGVDVGSTNMIIQGKSGRCSVVDVSVAIDTGTLQASLAALMPEETGIRVSAAADTLVLSGTVADAGAVARALELANAYVRHPARGVGGGKPDAAKPEAAGIAAPPAASAANGAGSRVINLLAVSAPQQVMLEVKVAEVSKTLLDKLEVSAALHAAGGGWAATLLSNFVTGTLNGALGLSKAASAVNLQAQKEDSLVRVLAEPTLMALSGQEASFLSGGKFYIPVAQDNNRITLEEKEFGVGVRFMPTVLAGGRINIRVAPEVSDLSRDGIGISASGTGGTAILPVLTSNRASTTVQLYDGQSFAIGGLIKNNLVTDLKGLPVLGELPVIGALFRSTDFEEDRTELLFVVTVHLVQPLPAVPALPTDKVSSPSRGELFLGGQIQGAAPATIAK